MVSIIMPTYNRAYVIQRAIDSVLEQTYRDWELIIVDDGSTDDTEAVVKKNTDERIRYIRYTPNQGANHARNVGLGAAKGAFLAFLDTDVVWKKTFLEIRVNILEKEDVDFVWGRVARFPMESRKVNVLPVLSRDELNSPRNLLHRQLTGGAIDTNVVCFKRKIYDQIGGFDEALMRLQEQEFFLRIILSGFYKFCFTGDILVKSYMKTDSISQKPERLWKSFIYIIQKHLAEYRKYNCLRPAWRLLLSLEGANQTTLQDFLSILSDAEYMQFMSDMMEYIEQQRIQIETANKMIIKRGKEKMKMNWRFPREKIPDGSRIIIYGAGDVGTSFMQQIAENHWCSVVLWVDKNYKEKGCMAIHSPQRIKNCVFDYIVVSIADKKVANQAKEFLQDIGVSSEQIIMIGA